MKLEFFEYIEKVLKLIENQSDVLNKAADELENFFTNSFFINDHFLNVNYRIKSPESLKEKILRHNLYLTFSTPEELVENLSDLIGFRIECRFISDEQKIYKEIMSLFSIKESDGYFSNPLNSNISLRLDEKQPQIQKNGFEIYKIDGRYIKENVRVNFELQIKSMVNVFWGDIDHRVLYKNFNYMLTEDFFKDIMSSIKDSLGMIDRQLMLVYNHLNDMDASNIHTKKSQLKALLSKMIHDLYIVKVRQELGLVIDFKKSTDVIVDYIFMRSGDELSDSYSSYFIKIINRLNEVALNDVSFDAYIEFDRQIYLEDDFSKDIQRILLNVINKDFKWNLFFKILFEIEEGTNAENFERFIIFIRDRLLNGLEVLILENSILENEREQTLSKLKDHIILRFEDNMTIDMINSCSLKILESELRSLLTEQ